MKRIYAPWRAEYLKSERSDECLFCSFFKDDQDEKNRIIHRGAHCFIVVNAYPYSNGHVMVVANRHIEHFNDLSADERNEMIQLVAETEQAVLHAYKPGGINIGANLGRSAGAGILNHLHVHVVPRWHGDTNFITAVGETRVISEDLLETYRQLREHFES